MWPPSLSLNEAPGAPSPGAHSFIKGDTWPQGPHPPGHLFCGGGGVQSPPHAFSGPGTPSLGPNNRGLRGEAHGPRDPLGYPG